jgi:hypothetical protein
MVIVRSAEEILQTLDARGTIDGLPFMPEMLQFCGRRFRVSTVAHKTCDTIHYSGIRKMNATVHLEDLRCDGAAHGSCEAGCLLFWKEAWLRPEHAPIRRATVPARSVVDLQALTRREGATSTDIRYVCQVTELLRASRPWAWWNVAQYVADVSSRNATLGQVCRVLVLASLRWLRVKAPSYGSVVRVYNAMARRWGVAPYYSRDELKGARTPTDDFDVAQSQLSAGDWVRVRSREEIVATLNNRGRHKGLGFDTEMVPYCGQKHRVRKVVTRIINEATGEMMTMKNPCIALEGVVCKSEYSERRFMCPRSILSFWRPIWLQRLDSVEGSSEMPPADRV